MFRWICLLMLAGAAACGGAKETVTPRDAPSSPSPEEKVPQPQPPSQPVAANEPYVILYPTGRPPVQVVVELAITPAERQRGLMYRKHMAPDRGMLFLFPEEEVQGFWMKNTLIPLDMIFIRTDMTVAGVVPETEPLSLRSRGVGVPSQYVLEVNGAWSAAHGVEAGTPVKFVNVPAPPAE